MQNDLIILCIQFCPWPSRISLLVLTLYIFNARYGECHPVFYVGSLDNAIRDSLLCSAKEVSDETG